MEGELLKAFIVIEEATLMRLSVKSLVMGALCMGHEVKRRHRELRELLATSLSTVLSMGRPTETRRRPIPSHQFLRTKYNLMAPGALRTSQTYC